MSPQELAAAVRDARGRTIELIAGLSGEALWGPRLPIVNPLLWEIGHVAWFQEKWTLRRVGLPPLRADADSLYDSAAIPHDARWDLPLPSLPETLAYLEEARDRLLARLEGRPPEPEEEYFVLLAVFHEDMHAEAFTYTRQTLGYPPPPPPMLEAGRPGGGGPLPGDVELPGGAFLLGAEPGEGFVFDNEKWAHPVELKPFSIARAPVTQAEFMAFVEEGGYARRTLWSEEGWRWRQSAKAVHPLYWRRAPGGWERRDFDRWVPIEPHRPVLHVNAHEAEAWCRWAGRRLPTEAEWEMAASFDPRSARKRRHPWGDDPPSPAQANLDGRACGTVEVGALPEGVSPAGCRQMLGNVWEWTASAFEPYPGFTPDPYREYSQPWFHTHRVLRGGCWATRSRLIRNTWRNFYTPDRRDVWAGFRTCAG